VTLRSGGAPLVDETACAPATCAPAEIDEQHTEKSENNLCFLFKLIASSLGIGEVYLSQRGSATEYRTPKGGT
jgi:hypothetical protein